jgi:hypothetical protein
MPRQKDIYRAVNPSINREYAGGKSSRSQRSRWPLRSALRLTDQTLSQDSKMRLRTYHRPTVLFYDFSVANSCRNRILQPQLQIVTPANR